MCKCYHLEEIKGQSKLREGHKIHMLSSDGSTLENLAIWCKLGLEDKISARLHGIHVTPILHFLKFWHFKSCFNTCKQKSCGSPAELGSHQFADLVYL